jgi:hypothetical protein
MPRSPEHERRLDAYVARVRALSAAEWGRLDATGTRLMDNTPWARVRRARLDADSYIAFTRLVPREVAVGGATVARAVADVGRWLGTRPSRDPLAPPRRPIQLPTDPRWPEPTPELRAAMARSERWYGRVAEIRRLVREAPATARSESGGAAAIRVLEYGLTGLTCLEVDRDAALRLYAPVEPVIPFASLDGTQPRLPGGSP